jgi:hypothetical protein
MGGVGVGVDDDHRVLQSCSGRAHGLRKGIDVAERDRLAIDGVLPRRVHRHVDLVRPIGLLLGLRARKIDLQFGILAVRRGDHEEDQDHQQDVDHRDQVDLGIFLERAAKIHRVRL